MPRNVELIEKQFGSDNALPSIELAENANKLRGIDGDLYALKSDLNGEVSILLSNINNVLNALTAHEGDDTRHLTPADIQIINSAINATRALEIANEAIDNAKAGIVASATQTAINTLTPVITQSVANGVTTAKKYTDDKLGEMNLPTYVDPETGETKTEDIGQALETSPQSLINPEYFYNFKNMIDNSSFEVFDGNTMIPIGWDNGVVSADASMFGTYSLHLTAGQTAKQTTNHQPDAEWFRDVYDTNAGILSFYHKFNAVSVKVYDIVNESYLTLCKIDQDLAEGQESTEITFSSKENWDRYRNMVKITMLSTTRKIRVELTCGNGQNGCYIDALSLEPYDAGKFPSIYKDGRYSVSAYQVLNPPPADVDRFTPLEHLSIDANATVTDARGNVTTQEYDRADGTLAIRRVCDLNSVDSYGNYQTITETFYKKDGVTPNYTDTYSITYSPSGAILSQTKTTTEGGL